MALQINVHRSMNFDTLTREPWDIQFHTYKGFAVVKIQCGSDSVTFFDDDMENFMNNMLAAWDELNGRPNDNEL